MTNLEFITANRVSKIPKIQLYEFIITKVSNHKIVIMEDILDSKEKMDLIAKSFEKGNQEGYYGLKMLQIKIKGENMGLLRNKQKDINFNLFAPGTSIIEQEEDGHYSVRMEEGNAITASF
ncbi:MAG: hypothetical protein ACXAB7_18445 [Candidatus Kariarchaeaceae archaeon]|jgi:hypothetical protein